MLKSIGVTLVSLFVACSIGLVCSGCPTTTNPPPEPPVTVVGADASDAAATGSVTNACAKITSLCAIDGGTCSAGFTLMLSNPLQPLIDFACITNASSKQMLQACPGVGQAGCP